MGKWRWKTHARHDKIATTQLLAVDLSKKPSGILQLNAEIHGVPDQNV